MSDKRIYEYEWYRGPLGPENRHEVSDPKPDWLFIAGFIAVLVIAILIGNR